MNVRGRSTILRARVPKILKNYFLLSSLNHIIYLSYFTSIINYLMIIDFLMIINLLKLLRAKLVQLICFVLIQQKKYTCFVLRSEERRVGKEC